MIEKNEIIQTSDGNMDTFVVHPDQDNKFPLIVFLMDAPGKREELHDMAQKNCIFWILCSITRFVL